MMDNSASTKRYPRLFRRFPGLHSPSGGTAAPSLPIRKHLTYPFFALFALLTAGLLFMLPGGLLQAQESTIGYAENGMGPVATYTAVDPEGAEIVWELTGADAGDFKIEGGVLNFKSSPNYEAAADADTNNVYVVTVEASDGGALEDTKAVSVTVSNVEEPGKVELSALQPKAGVALTATLTDPDNITATNATGAIGAGPGITWQWASSPDGSTSWTDIEDETSPIYTPGDADAGEYLRATVAYKDMESTETTKSAVAVSAHAVLAHRSQNEAPAFPDQEADEDGVQGDQKRSVAENTPVGQPIGAPVAATDKDAADVLTYTLSGDQAAFFSIDSATGQLSTKTKLDFEEPETGVQNNEYEVMVTATDPFGIPGSGDATNSVTIMVTIEVTNVDEDPTVSEGATTINHIEGGTALLPTAEYTGTDPEDTDSDLKWSVAGADSSKFEVDPATGTTTTLAFKAAPDFEVAGDANGDNLYEVTVVVTDSKTNTGMRAVTIKVTNMEEDGTVTLSSLQPRIGVPITASLTDPDGGVSGVTWQWYNGAINPGDLNTNAIDKATSATYTPVTADNNQTLRARASYTDGQGADSAVGESANQVLVDTRNKAPVFPDQDADTAGDQLDQERSVGEDAVSPAVVGEPVTAEDATGDTLTYTLGGADAALFAIDRASGQITVGPGTKLDKETQDSYTVTVTATDSFTASSTITVTIKVTNVDEPPDLNGPATAGYPENEMGPVATYTAADPEGKAISWSLLAGTDAGNFKIEGGVLNFKSAPDYEAAADADTNNVYEVTVQAGDGGTDPATKAVTVTVSNVEEPGKVELSTLQPKAGLPLTATLTDPDMVTTGTETWQWASSSNGSTWIDIEDETSPIYTPKDGDVDKHLRATAEYKDDESTEITRSARAVAASVVLAHRSQNKAPAFPDQEADEDGVQGDQKRSVAENTPVGQPIGAPVAATDEDAADVLTYTLSGDQAAFFSIDSATGQLSTKTKLDFEEPETGVQNNEYEVMVTATDPFGIPGSGDATNSVTIMVTIEVTNVDEDPTVSEGATTINHIEGGTALLPTAEYTGTDPEDTDSDLKWSVAGADSSKFEVDPATGTTTTLAFKAAPDFEVAGDANGDNVYEVTVVVTDSKTNTGMRAVTIKVTNMEEDGTVTLSSLQPRIGVPITASLTDPDGGVSGVTWQWYNGAINPGDLNTNAIDKATSATYTPVTADNNQTLRARASYTDGQGADSAVGESASTVAVDTRNKAPEFPDQDADTAGDQLDQERSVMENEGSPAVVGEPVTANTDDPNLTYTLGGADAALFAIDRASGQITVGPGTKLDKETRDTYTVTVTATDSFGIGSTITVTIKVTNVDEAPVISVGGLVVNVDEAGTVTLSSQAPVVGTKLTASLADADGDITSITWQWASSDTMDGTFTPIEGATSDSYTPVADDVGEHLRATAMYTDGHGPGKSEMATSANEVTAADAGDPVGRYDTNNNGRIDKDELADGVFDYNVEQTLSKDELVELIFSYEIG